MVSVKRLIATVLVGVSILLSSCAPQDGGIPITGDTPLPGETSVLPGLPPQAVLEAQRWLAELLSVSVEQARIVEVEQAEWTDSCLGLGRPEESCLQVITAGWKAVFEINGVTYEVRTDETASTIRVAPSEGASENSLENTHWSLVSFGSPGAGQPLVEGSTITLMMASGQAGGYGGCNSYGGTYQVDGNMVSFEQITSTLRACADDRVTDQEQRYFQALESAALFERMDQLMMIFDEDGNELLTFETPISAGPGILQTPGP